jgi:hypothetical protein
VARARPRSSGRGATFGDKCGTGAEPASTGPVRSRSSMPRCGARPAMPCTSWPGRKSSVPAPDDAAHRATQTSPLDELLARVSALPAETPILGGSSPDWPARRAHRHGRRDPRARAGRTGAGLYQQQRPVHRPRRDRRHRHQRGGRWDGLANLALGSRGTHRCASRRSKPCRWRSSTAPARRRGIDEARFLRQHRAVSRAERPGSNIGCTSSPRRSSSGCRAR